MTRSPVETRSATLADVPVLLRLAEELRTVGGRAERAVNPVTTPDLGLRLAEAIESDRCEVLLASVEGEPAGMAVLRRTRPDPLSDSCVLQLSHVVVTRAYRRRGVGHMLLAAAVEIADEQRLEHVQVEVYPSLREASRFYARLGFAPVTVRRVAPVAVLRRRLTGEAPALRGDDIVRRRTRLRRPLPAQRAGRRATLPVD